MARVQTIVAYEWLGNTVQEYVVAAVIFLAAVVVLRLIQQLIVSRASRWVEKTETELDNAVVSMVETIKPPFYWFMAFYIALQWLTIQGTLERAVEIILLIWVTYQVVVALHILVGYGIAAKVIREGERASEVVASIVTAVARILLWALGILFVLSNLGVNVTSLIAGLGIGGLAIALAAQKLLEDLFSSLAIYFDRPFAPGDFIVVGDTKGTVQKVGIKTTRLKSLLGEEVIIPNKDITSTRVQNFKRMQRRRVDFKIGVAYDTPQEKMKAIPDLIEKIITGIENTEFDRVHFLEFGDSSLVFEAVYFVDSREFDLYVDVHQQVLLGIKEAFEQQGIEIAYPTRTVRLVQAHT